MVAKDDLMQDNKDCLNAVMYRIFETLRESQRRHGEKTAPKILCTGGEAPDKVTEIYNSSANLEQYYPNDFRDYLTNSVHSSMYLRPTSPFEILCVIKQLN